MEIERTKNCVMDRGAVERKIKRMALEVAEKNTDEKEMTIAGICGNGEVVAQCLAKELTKVTDIKIEYVKIQLNKKDPLEVSLDSSVIPDDKMILIVDDVADSGRTMFYALKPFLNARPRKIQTLVLVERSHKLYPVQTDYTGLSVSTTLQEHIVVEVEGETIMGAWLY